MSYNELASELHAAAVKKGFWNVDDAVRKHLAKMISELGEVVQADRAGIMYEIEHEGAKPEGVAAELADFVMMALDYCAQAGIDVDGILSQLTYTEFCEELDEKIAETPAHGLVLIMNCALAYLTNGDVIIDRSIAVHSICYGVRRWLELRGYDLFEIIRLKMEYNQKSRAYLHGRKY